MGTMIKITFELLDTDKLALLLFKEQSPSQRNDECFWKHFTKPLAAKQQDQLLITLLNFLLPVEECRLLNTFLYSGSNCALSIESSSELKQFYFPNL
jgi:hypothetical protein